jgi:hypothetical protein
MKPKVRGDIPIRKGLRKKCMEKVRENLGIENRKDWDDVNKGGHYARSRAKEKGRRKT